MRVPKTIGITILLLFSHGSAFAQAGASTFEAASVKPAAPPIAGFRVIMGENPGRVNYSNVSLKDIISHAYQVKDYQISGPEWLSSQRFDIIATLPPNTPKDQIPLMLQSLLAERFKLTLHREKKDLPGYALVVAKNGPKLHESPVDAPAATGDGPPVNEGVAIIGGGGRGLGGGGGGARLSTTPPVGGSFITTKGRGHVEGKRQVLSSIASMLAREIEVPVVDETRLKGIYDYTLDWTADGSAGGPRLRTGGRGPQEAAEAAVAPALSDSSAPSLSTAIQEQLGLKLEARRVPLDLLVIDHAEKVPTEN